MSTDAKTVSIMSALAVEVAFKRWIVPSFEQQTGIRASIVWDPTTVLMRRVESGERADIILAIDHAMDQLVQDDIVRRDTRIPVARAMVGLAVRKGAPRPDISTVEALKATLLAAPSVAYSLGGASGIYFQRLIEQLGIADEVKARGVTIPAGFTATKVASGEAEYAVQQISELMSVEGVDVVGPFPEAIQAFTDFSAAIFTDARNPEAAQAFLDSLGSDEAVGAYEKGGLSSLVRAPSAA
ncbi:substrate-binding domain-containing protein [Ancylobacter sp. A5.8]|uniref:molybdate ABC transporter substrate-binding protein n=1 Tax=Ancylobacter gelatini TaxID=2919920 RepID=UPI001F4DA36E|nr:substrate-binding domain-containing protein [Ancylobacter gelatini]MCJ8141400.1 substrate-binding domain-containing protein [Ancylobacter gelatini]